MGTTTKHLLPYPEPNASVDIPRDVKALAEAVDTLDGLPYAMFTALLFIPGNGTASAGAAVTFPAGRFTTGPAVALTTQYFAYVNVAIASDVGAGGLTVGVYNVDGGVTALGTNYPIHLIAVQATGTGMGAPGTRVGGEAPPGVPAAATCHTAGCGNSGIAMHLDVPSLTALVICGVCSQPITDVVSA